MKNQIFRTEVPVSLLFALLDRLCMKTEKYYYIDFLSFRKFMFEEAAREEWLASLRPFYYESKQHYLDRKMTYNSFINIVRQICKKNQVPFTSKIRYDKTSYNIDYYIFHTPELPRRSSRGSLTSSPRGSPRGSPKTSPRSDARLEEKRHPFREKGSKEAT